MSMDAPEGMEVFKYDGQGMPVFRKIRKSKAKPKMPPHPLGGLNQLPKEGPGRLPNPGSLGQAEE
jgi:hypothetical protein